MKKCDVDDKVAIVTGANKGIGFLTVKNLALNKKISKVIMTSRSLKRGKISLQTLIESHGCDKNKIDLLELDITSERSINEFSRIIKKKYKKITLLVNNAAYLMNKSKTEFFEVVNESTVQNTMDTNYFGTYKLTQALYDCICTKNGKILHVSSIVGTMLSEKQKKIFFSAKSIEELNKIVNKFIEIVKSGKYKGSVYETSTFINHPCYGYSKLALNSLTHLTAKKEKKILIFCCHPGFCSTDMTLNTKSARNPESGANTIVWGLLNATRDKYHGKIYRDEGKILNY